MFAVFDCRLPTRLRYRPRQKTRNRGFWFLAFWLLVHLRPRESLSQLRADARERRLSRGNDGAQRVEMMDHACVAEMANRHARALQRPSEERALVPHGVVFGGVDQRGGRTSEIGAQRRDAGIVRPEAVGAIELPI